MRKWNKEKKCPNHKQTSSWKKKKKKEQQTHKTQHKRLAQSQVEDRGHRTQDSTTLIDLLHQDSGGVSTWSSRIHHCKWEVSASGSFRFRTKDGCKRMKDESLDDAPLSRSEISLYFVPFRRHRHRRCLLLLLHVSLTTLKMFSLSFFRSAVRSGYS